MSKNKFEIGFIKIFLLFFIFAAISLALVFVLIIPSLSDYKRVNLHLSKQESLNQSLKKDIKIKKDKLQKLINKDNRADLLKSNFHIDKLKAYMDKFFKETKFSKIKITNKKFTSYEFSVETRANTPGNFYNFLDQLSSYKNIIKIDYPVLMQAQKDGIKINFNVKIYKNLNH